MDTDTEMKRILSNPEHVLMSDSLEGLIDPHLLEEPDVWDTGDFVCRLKFANFKISGILKSFSHTVNQKTMSVLIAPSDAIKLLTNNFLNSYECRDITKKVVFKEIIENEISLSVTFQENESALVSITFKLSTT